MTPGQRFSLALAFLASILLGGGEAFADVSPEPYVGLQGGVFLWPAYSNRDEVEADTGPGFAWAIVGGLDFESDHAGVLSSSPPLPLLERLGGRLELEVGQRFAGIHGINDGPLQLTGDGKTLRATSVQLNLWPAVRVAHALRVYLGGGGGGAWIRGLGSDKRVWSAQVGFGVLIDLPIQGHPVRLDLGWRSFFANSTKLRDALADFDAHGGSIGLQVGF